MTGMGYRTMRAAVFDGVSRFVPDYPIPERKPGWSLVRVSRAGICGTDLEIAKGYMGFRGVLGHEFVGVVEETDAPALRGRRVVGEINAACGVCDYCRKGLGRHCPHRVVLGIAGLDGCMAEYCVLPDVNLRVLSDDISDARAVLTEPLAAAREILDQITFRGDETVVVLGDGKLGMLCAWTLATVLPSVTLIGHHPENARKALWRGVRNADIAAFPPASADVVVEATGNPAGLETAIGLCRSRGTIVQKSTVADRVSLDLAPVVVREISIIGSRCGRFDAALELMAKFPDMPLERLIAAEYPLEKFETAFAAAKTRGTLKIVLII